MTFFLIIQNQILLRPNGLKQGTPPMIFRVVLPKKSQELIILAEIFVVLLLFILVCIFLIEPERLVHVLSFF